MRPSDADRNRVVDVLAAAFAEGRLGGDEHRRRVDAVFQAQSFARLCELTADLPAGAMPLPLQYAPYAQPPAGYLPAGPYGYQPQATDACSVTSLVMSLCAPALSIFFVLPAIVAVVCGHVALGRADRHSSGSRGMAIAGLIIGYLEVVGALGLVMLIIASVSV